MKLQGKTDDELLDKYGKLIEKRDVLIRRIKHPDTGTGLHADQLKLDNTYYKMRKIEDHFKADCTGGHNCSAVMHEDECYNGSNA